jgi:colanic acid/amylovoran biosynthesis glycosyltransferase
MGLESRVVFWGELNGNALKAVYRVCDVFCLPCRKTSMGVSEGFPTVLMEAMAFGKPVVTTRHVEIPRLIPEILVEENDVHGLAEAILKLYRSQPLRERLGRQNREIAQAKFSLRNTERTVQLLCELSGKNQLTQSIYIPLNTPDSPDREVQV